MINSAPSSSAPAHSTSTPARFSTPIQPGGGPGSIFDPATDIPAGAPAAHPEFWKWAIAFLLFWFIVVALHEYGGNAQSIGSGFALLVLTTVLLTQGGKAMTNAVALFQNA